MISACLLIQLCQVATCWFAPGWKYWKLPVAKGEYDHTCLASIKSIESWAPVCLTNSDLSATELWFPLLMRLHHMTPDLSLLRCKFLSFCNEPEQLFQVRWQATGVLDEQVILLPIIQICCHLFLCLWALKWQISNFYLISLREIKQNMGALK